MSSDIAIRVQDVSKHYLIYRRPDDRLKQMVLPKLRGIARLPEKRYYTDFAAVQGVNLEVRKGQTLGIIGRNGSGKSTLLQMICGTLQPSSGSVEVNGRIAALLELGAGFNPEFTGRENVRLNCAILGLTAAETEQRFEAIERFADIGIFIDQPVKTYSSGMYVRLAFAVAINVDPDILVVDEALAVGDEAFQRKCYARIDQIRESGATILFVSHGAQTIVQLCDRAVLMDGGEVLMDGEPRRVVAQYQRLINLQGVRFHEVRESLKTMDVSSEQSLGETTSPAVELLHAADVAKQKRDAEIYAALEGLDNDLKSETIVEYEPNGARIRNVRIENADGAVVNSLAMGRSYTVAFEVDFQEDAELVEIGHHYSTAEGFHLGGRFITKDEAPMLANVSAGTTVMVSFKFECRFVPKVYTLSVGLRGMKNGNHDYLGRIVDALIFRVRTSKPIYFGGHYDFQMQPIVTELSSKRLVHAGQN